MHRIFLHRESESGESCTVHCVVVFLRSTLWPKVMFLWSTVCIPNPTTCTTWTPAAECCCLWPRVGPVMWVYSVLPTLSPSLGRRVWRSRLSIAYNSILHVEICSTCSCVCFKSVTAHPHFLDISWRKGMIKEKRYDLLSFISECDVVGNFFSFSDYVLLFWFPQVHHDGGIFSWQATKQVECFYTIELFFLIQLFYS